ncbi:MAG: ATP-binding protein [Opitutaceae bacterium]|jgi:signal transduction histidine kinase
MSHSIHRQILLFACLICLAVLLPVGGVLLLNHISQFKTKLSQSFQATARIIATNSSAALAFNDKAAAKEILESLVNDHSISSAVLYDKAGGLLVSYGEIPSMSPSAQRNDGFSSVRVEVSYKGEPYGQLLLLSRYPAELRSTIATWVFVYCTGILLAGALAFMLASRFHRAVAVPLQLLANTAADVTASQNYNVRMPVNGPREISELAKVFNAMLEEIGRRDADLAAKSVALSLQLKELRREVQEREAAEQRLRENNREMMRLSREAGMAEVATGVLHNIGNALNSINVSTELLFAQIQDQARGSSSALRDFFTAPPENAAAVFSSHPTGPGVKKFATSLSSLVAVQMEEASRELAALRTGVTHLKDIVSRQQSLAKNAPISEPFDLREAISDAILLNKISPKDVSLRIEQPPEGPVTAYADRGSVVQILINLITNAREAVEETQGTEKIILIGIARTPDGEHTSVSVTDNGCGIASDQLVSIFSYGFTTKKGGHGFGLHNAANIARLMGGSLLVQSDGPGKGTTFTLMLPSSQSLFP